MGLIVSRKEANSEHQYESSELLEGGWGGDGGKFPI